MQNLLRGKATQETYVTYLRSLSIIHSVIERAISKSEHGVLKAIWREDMRKLPLLQSDTQDLCDGQFTDQPQPISISLKIVQVIRSLTLQNPVRLSGYLYVLEGATNGGTHIYPRVTQAFGLTGDVGVKYLKSYDETQPAHWRAFKERLNSAVNSEENISEALEGAKEFYDSLIAILDSLGTNSGVKRIHATAINPEAGTHNVPQNELELKAAKLAANACLIELPYVQDRYSERGVRYTKSDGAWLATLPDLPPEVVMKQVNWLAKFLSALGMPRFTLEMHLRETQKALTSLLPQNEDKYNVLGVAAAHLESVRNELIPLALQNELRQAFDFSLKNEESKRFRNLSRVLISSVADEKIDRSGALEKTLLWIKNDSTWPIPIVNACQSLILELRAAPMEPPS